jgi:hypothetical protein
MLSRACGPTGKAPDGVEKEFKDPGKSSICMPFCVDRKPPNGE